MNPSKFGFESMGTKWQISVYDVISAAELAQLEAMIFAAADKYDKTYSRFIKTSLVWSLSQKPGKYEVPAELITMLRLYKQLYKFTAGKVNPLVGFTLNDIGYDAEYSLSKKEHVRPTPDFNSALTILDDNNLHLHEEALIDIGALGKGFFVDKAAAILRDHNIKQFMVNGSGDIYYQGKEAIRVGLEHPEDTSKVIGVITITGGSVCASATNKRKWGNYNHYLDPHSQESPAEIIASWVCAENAVLADGLATALFFAKPEELLKQFKFEYLVLNKDYSANYSASFGTELY